MKPLLERRDDLSPSWLSSVLRGAGLDVDVVDLEIQPIGTGQVGTSLRLTPTYAAGRGAGPETLVAKLAAGDLAARRRVVDAFRKEVGFYAQLAHTLDVRVPRCWYSAISEDGTAFTLILEDIFASRPGVQVEGCSPDQARAAVRNLAALHAPRWNDATLFDLEFVRVADTTTASFLGDILRSATEQFIERFDSLDGETSETLRRCAHAIGPWVLARPTPFAVTHGDYRLDNLMFPRTGSDVVALDWQTVNVGPPARDLSYFLGTGLTTARRRSHEESLVGHYHAELEARGVSGYTADQCFEDYRLGQLQGPMITVLGAIYAATAQRSQEGDDMFCSMAERSCRAILDLGSLALLESQEVPETS